MGKLVQATTLNELVNLEEGRAITVGQMKQLGDTGLGTLQRNGGRVVGEITMVDGHPFVTFKGGLTGELADDNKVYFGEFARFAPEKQIEVDAADRAELAQQLSGVSAESNYMVRITGKFQSLTLRSVDGGAKTYRTLGEIVTDQEEFAADTGKTYDIVGIFTAAGLASKVSPAGLHLHAVSDDRTAGGHILDFKGLRGSVQLMPVDKWNLLAHCRPDGSIPEQKTLPLQTASAASPT